LARQGLANGYYQGTDRKDMTMELSYYQFSKQLFFNLDIFLVELVLLDYITIQLVKND
jgi:hypothetical protein